MDAEELPLLGGEERGIECLYGGLESRLADDLVLVLVAVNVISFVLSTVDAIDDKVGTVFDVIEAVSVALFTIEYGLRMVAIGVEDKYAGWSGRAKWMVSFFSLVDLAAIMPFYVGLAIGDDVGTTQFVRILRVFRMFRAEGRLVEAFTLLDDVVRANRALLATSSFMGAALWLLLAGVLYATEKDNPDVAGEYDTFFKALWYALLNLLGEFPIAAELSSAGKAVSCFTVVFAVGFFSIPTGIIGAGLLDMLTERRNARAVADDSRDAANVSREHSLCRGCEASARQAHIAAKGLGGRLYLVLDGVGVWGRIIEACIMALIVVNVVVFSISTLPDIGYDGAFFVFEAMTVGLFSVEYLLRLWTVAFGTAGEGETSWQARARWVVSFESAVDLASIVPFYVDLALTGTDVSPTTLLRVLRLVRLLKADSYVHVFDLMDDVVRANGAMLATTAWVALVVWILAASLMYATERHNSNLEVASEFESVPEALWITFLNLTGEYPLADYTPWGKVVSSVVALVAIGVAALPTGIWAAGFEDALAEAKAHTAEDTTECEQCISPELAASSARLRLRAAAFVPLAAHSPQRAAQLRSSGQSAAARAPDWIRSLYAFVSGATRAGAAAELVVVGLIFVNTITFVLGSVDSVAASATAVKVFEVLEGCTMAVFAVEYAARVIAAGADAKYARFGWPRLRYCCSLFALLDLACLVPYGVELVTRTELSSTVVFRLFRLMFLLKSESFVSVFTLLDDVFVAKAPLLLSSAFVAGVCLIVFATLLHYTEQHNEIVVNDLSMAARYESIPSALWYTLVHLTGDYPLYQYTWWGKGVNFVSALTAVGVVGIPSAAIASGFVSARAAIDGGEFGGERDDALPLIPAAGDDARCRQCRVERARATGVAGWLHALFVGDLRVGHWPNYLLNGLIAVNLVAFALGTEPSVRAGSGGRVGDALDVVEWISVTVFTIEYVARLVAADADPDWGYSRLRYGCSFFALVDLTAIVPFYVSVAIGDRTSVSTLLRALRVVRVLKGEHSVEAFTLVDNVVAATGRVLATTGFAAALVWIISASLFYIAERSQAYTDGAFDNMLLSLFFTMIFLGGEWAVVDFTPWGEAVGAFTIVLAIAIFAVPGGILFDGFADIANKRRELRDQLASRDLLCSGCGAHIQSFVRHHVA
ncbi:ion transporter [Thecamonas trahens ATCC 50062]|uniref:Ion transporter n=1 Tax=Thecamonas trahens ATCC 50062 TaxID=461836 RepID=A0A0L0D5N5_THETB|nr:ion transporter [Thecamonas trahens ATCC 50062]KNC47682.1 ion transporter [Thecamonas trahens ATCC 50062]|eukprot:XP_013759166.1 ion transporter [Thecamonas trahens ATCC 50062]